MEILAVLSKIYQKMTNTVKQLMWKKCESFFFNVTIVFFLRRSLWKEKRIAEGICNFFYYETIKPFKVKFRSLKREKRFSSCGYSTETSVFTVFSSADISECFGSLGITSCLSVWFLSYIKLAPKLNTTKMNIKCFILLTVSVSLDCWLLV